MKYIGAALAFGTIYAGVMVIAIGAFFKLVLHV